jgi:hypothetical protein
MNRGPYKMRSGFDEKRKRAYRAPQGAIFFPILSALFARLRAYGIL